jgi:hypothetical protein
MFMSDTKKKSKLISPYGGTLVNLVVDVEEREELLARSSRLPSIKSRLVRYAIWNC